MLFARASSLLARHDPLGDIAYMGTFVRAVRRISDACAAIAAVFLAASVVIVCYMIVRRSLGYSSYWEIEGSIYLMVAAVFLASPYTLRTGGHVAVDLVPDSLRGNLKRIYLIALYAVGFSICVYLAWEGARLTAEAFIADERTISMWRPPRWPMYAMMPLGMSLTALEALSAIFRLIDNQPLPDASPNEIDAARAA